MDYKKLGQRIKEERKKLGLTQEQLAEDVNLSTNYISMIERGKRTATLDTIANLAIRFGVTIDYLLQDTIPIKQQNTSIKLFQLLENYSEDEQKQLLNIINSILTFEKRKN